MNASLTGSGSGGSVGGMNQYGIPDAPPLQPGVDPTAALAALHYHLASAGILNMLHEAWGRCSDEAKTEFADRVLAWAGMNIGQLGATDLIQHMLGQIVKDGRFVLDELQEATLVQLLYTNMVGLLKDTAKSERWETDRVRAALVAAAKERLGEVAAEMSAAALAEPKVVP